MIRPTCCDCRQETSVWLMWSGWVYCPDCADRGGLLVPLAKYNERRAAEVRERAKETVRT